MPKPFHPVDHDFSTSDFAVVAALLDYYGLPYTQRSLNDYLHRHSFGSLMTEIADCLQQHGVETTLINANPLLFTKKVWDQVFLLDYPKVTPEKLPPFNEVDRVIAKGVYLKRLLPSITILDEQMAAERPVVISYNPALIDSLRPQGVSHALIAPGDESTYTLFEPDYENSIAQFSKQHILYAITGVHSIDPSADSIILGKPKAPAPVSPPVTPPDLDTIDQQTTAP